MNARTNEFYRLIVVADDELSSFRGITRLSEGLHSSVHHVTSRSELLNWLHEHQTRLENPATALCVVFDPKIVEISAEEPIRGLLLGYPKICISRSNDVAITLRSIKIGLFDFIEKPFRLTHMSNILEQAFIHYEFGIAIKKQFHSLTKREIETCELVIQGHSNKEMSEKLDISIKTVKVHRANLMRKTDAKSVADLLRLHDRFSSITRSEIKVSNGFSAVQGLGVKQLQSLDNGQKI